MAYKIVGVNNHNFYPGETFRTRKRALEAREDAKRITGRKAFLKKAR